MRILLLLLVSCLSCLFAQAQKQQVRLFSPSMQIRFNLSLKEGKARYDVVYLQDTVLRDGSLGFILDPHDSLTRFTSFKSVTSSHDARWRTVWGSSSPIRDHYNALQLELTVNRTKRKVILDIRLYDDGFAYRYTIPKQAGLKQITVMSEESRFTLPAHSHCWWSWADYNTLEKTYFHTALDSATHVATPFTLQTKHDVYMAIHEAAILDYSTMTLKQDSLQRNRYHVNLVPWADGSLVKAEDSLRSPWRAFIIGSSPGALIESNLLLNLNAPCKLNDVSWIQPMTYTGIWWEMHLGLSTWKMGPKHGATTANAKRYIDFAAQNGIKGVLMEGWNTGWENWGRQDAFDFTTAYPDLDLEEVVRYAKAKGVEIIGHHETGGDTRAYEQHMEKAFQLYRDLGIRIVKTGYAGPVTPAGEHHHGQCMVRHYNKVMETAARYHLMLDVHESIPLSGLCRTWPNLMTAEGVRGMEWNAWSDGNPPSHTCTLPFTRGLAGPMDYTAGIFDIDLSARASERVKWNGEDHGHTAVHSTLANQLALMIVLYSPLQMAADLPENYAQHPAFDCMRSLPTTWNETKVLDAKIGEYIILARRSGKHWYIAGITNEEGRELDISLSFLKKAFPLKATLFEDGEGAHYEANPEVYHIRELSMSGNTFHVVMAPGGGFVLRLGK